jgi:hypothetical protein
LQNTLSYLRGVTLTELDRALAYWQQASDTIAANVFALYEHPTYKVLAGDARSASPKLAGLTLSRAGSVVDDVSALMAQSTELKQVIARAAEMRKAILPFFQTERIRDVEAILAGPSIHLPEVEIPLAQRGLLVSSVAEHACSPRQLLDAMTPVYETAKSAILAIDDAWGRLDMLLSDAETKVDSLLKIEPDSRDVLGVQRRVSECRTLVAADPLSCIGTLEGELNPILEKTRKHLDDAIRERQQFETDLAAAKSTLEQVAAGHKSAVAAFEERVLKVTIEETPEFPPPVEAPLLEDLARWLSTLNETAARGSWRPAKVGLGRWNTQARQYADTDQQSAEASQRLIARRTELRGLLDAFKAKATATHLAENMSISEIGSRAKNLLFTRPTPLREAESLVSDYQRRLNSL